MSYLINAIKTEAPEVDQRLKGKIYFSATEEIPKEIRAAMADVLAALADQLEKEKKDFGFPISCLFITNRDFGIALNDDQIAVCMRLAVYTICELMPYAGTWKLYMLLAEELCHLIWDIRDEVLVNFKVLEITRNIYPQMCMSDLYSRQAVDACRLYAAEHPAELLPGLG